MKRFFHLIFVALSAVIISSCRDEPNPTPNGEENYIEFHLSEAGNESLGEIISKEVVIVLNEPKARNTYSFTGAITFDPSAEAFDAKGAYSCRLNIGQTKIADGSYFVEIMLGDRQFGGRNLISFKDGVAQQMLFSQMSYDMLEGSGTAEAPYLICDAADLLTFLFYLGEDEYHGYGLYFKQTASFDAPRRSEIIDGRSWTSTYFQGTYDGGNHEIRNLAYIGGGNSADDNIGLFRGLFSATVKNLKISNAIISGGGSNVGLLCGVCEGNAAISNVKIGRAHV